jgi:CotS family spore coat protein
MNEYIILEVLAEYGIAPNKITLIRERENRCVWEISGDKKNYALKLVRPEIARIVGNVGVYLFNRGVPVITVLPTMENDFFVQHNDVSFVLFPWFEGEAIDYDTPGTIKKMSSLLADFHVASRGYEATRNPIKKKYLEYASGTENMNKVYKESIHDNSQMVKVFSSHYDWLQKRCIWVIERLPDLLAASAIFNPDLLLSHGDYARINILSDKNGDWKIIDLDTVRISPPMTDVSKMITLINHDLGNWDSKRYQFILECYRKIRPLFEGEEEFLMIDQCFPHQAIDLLISYYNKSTSTTLVEELERCLATDQEKLKEFQIHL